MLHGLEDCVTLDQSVRSVPVDALEAVTTGIFRALGCPGDEPSIIAEELVNADQMGLHSHGVLRIQEYVEAAQTGQVTPGGACKVVREFGGAILIDGGGNYGQVAARFALTLAMEKVRTSGVVCLVTRNCHHFGRIGSLSERAAAHDLICIATVAVDLPGPVAPWGALEGVLGTNPFSYGVPLDDGAVVTDFATSTIAEGVVRLAAQSGNQLPEGVLMDATGEPTTDPQALYASPRGAILPFGGRQGYKGYALNLLPELLAASLAGYGPHDSTRPANVLFLVLVDPAAFLPVSEFKKHAGDSARVVKQARTAPGSRVLLPGEREFEHRDAHGDVVEVATTTLLEIRQIAQQLDVAVDV